MMDIREKLMRLVCDALEDGCVGHCTYPHCLRVQSTADTLLANGVTVQERNEEGCPYCDIAKANEGVVNTKLLVKEAETSKWTMMGKRLIFCPMCGRALPQPPKGE